MDIASSGIKSTLKLTCDDRPVPMKRFSAEDTFESTALGIAIGTLPVFGLLCGLSKAASSAFAIKLFFGSPVIVRPNLVDRYELLAILFLVSGPFTVLSFIPTNTNESSEYTSIPSSGLSLPSLPLLSGQHSNRHPLPLLLAPSLPLPVPSSVHFLILLSVNELAIISPTLPSISSACFVDGPLITLPLTLSFNFGESLSSALVPSLRHGIREPDLSAGDGSDGSGVMFNKDLNIVEIDAFFAGGREAPVCITFVGRFSICSTSLIFFIAYETLYSGVWHANLGLR